MNACTVTIRRRLPFAQVLGESFLRHHSNGTFTALVLDEPWEEQDHTDRIELLTPGEIGIPSADLNCLAMLLDLDNLALAIIPRFLNHLTKVTGSPQLFLSDDVQVLHPLDELEEMARAHGVVLAPRTFSPLPEDGGTPDQAQLLSKGIYDPALVGVGSESSGFLDWWADAGWVEATRSEAPQREKAKKKKRRETPPLGRIFDLASVYFPCNVIQDPSLLASFWNVWGRTLEQANGATLIDGRPLKLFHFESYQPDAPHLLGATQGDRPRLLLSERPDMAALAEDYRTDLYAAGFEDARKLPGAFEALPGGLKVDDRMRDVYRRALRSHREEGTPAPPDPFDPKTPQLFVDWLNTGDPKSLSPTVPRYLLALYGERLDLQAAYPGLANADAGRFLDWVMRYGAKENRIPPELCRFDQSLRKPCNEQFEKPTRPDRLRLKPHFPFGLNVAGYFKAELGVGEMARLVLMGVEKASIPFSTYAYEARFSRQHHPFEPTEKQFTQAINLICVNADELQPFVRDTGTHIMDHRYTVGLWWWELEAFPQINADTEALFDEVWVGTDHVAKAVRAASPKPVHVIPIPIREISPPPTDRASLGLPDGFMFLFTFDFLSVVERKNPIGVVNAFTRAFTDGEGPVLVIKSINGADDLPALEMLRMAAAERSDIKIIDGYLPPERKDALMASCDSYVSLHRAEGYGLGMAEAMSLGKPVIATGYSGNLAFLNEENSYLVGHRLVAVPSGLDPYPEGARWAEPDLDQAAEFMRRVYEDPKEAEAVGLRAKRDASTIHTPTRTGEFISRRTSEIWDEMRSQERRELPARAVKSLIRRILVGVTRPSRR